MSKEAKNKSNCKHTEQADNKSKNAWDDVKFEFGVKIKEQHFSNISVENKYILSNGQHIVDFVKYTSFSHY